MDLIAVSPESEYANEAWLIADLLDAGLSRYHVRKPGWSSEQCFELLLRIPLRCRSRVSVHQYSEQVAEFGLGGFHYRDGAQVRAVSGARCASKSLHSLDYLDTHLAALDYAFLSPIFPSISKVGYAPSWDNVELNTALTAKRAAAKVYALGGMSLENSERSLELGFDGVVLHGALWASTDPVRYVEAFRKVVV